MTRVDPKIEETLSKYGEPSSGNVWFVQGQAVIYHRTLERIGARAAVVFEEPTILRAERDEAVILVRGRIGDRWDYDIGEALVNVNYRISGKQAGYVYAMALKRGRDRLILKLIGLHGLLYSEDESEEFKNGRTVNEQYPDPSQPAEGDPIPSEIKEKIDAAASVNVVTDLMLHPDTQKVLNDLPPGERDKVREYAKARLVALGWPSKKAA